MSAEAIPSTSNTLIPTNHPVGFWFFFWGEFAERCSYYGMRAILAMYMVKRLGVEQKDAGTYMSLFIAACYFFPLIGGWIADKFLGKYWTIVLFSLPYVVAQLMVGIENTYVVVGSLALLAMGSGVIKPNISTLMGLTYDQQRPGQDQLRTSAFNYFYMAINIGAFLSQFFMPILRDEYGYQAAFMFPAGLMVLALVLFALGKKHYGQETIVKKYIGPMTETPPERVTITNVPIKYVPQTFAQEEEERKLKINTLLSIGGLFLTVMFFWAIFDQSASTWIFFADKYMTNNLFGFKISADQIQAFNALFIVILVPISVAFFKFLSKKNINVKPTTKMLVGFGLTALSMFIMAFSATMSGKTAEQLLLSTPQGDLVIEKGDLKLETLAPSVSVTDAVDAVETETKLRQMEFPAADYRKKFEAPRSIGTDVKVTSKELIYNKDKKSLSFKSGSITAKGLTLNIVDGHLDDTLPTDEALVEAGLLESKLKSENQRKSITKNREKEKLEAEMKIAELKNSIKPEMSEADKKKIETQIDEAGIKNSPVSIKIVDWSEPKTRIPVLWQVFAFFIITIAEILISVTGLELAFVAAPKSMKGFVTACWLAVVFLANLLINAPITQLYDTKYFPPMNYFGMMGIAMVVVMVVYLPIAKKFNKTMAGKQPD